MFSLTITSYKSFLIKLIRISFDKKIKLSNLKCWMTYELIWIIYLLDIKSVAII